MDGPIKPIVLPEVVVTAGKPDPKRYKAAKVRLYPKGEALKSAVDSLKKVGYGKAIGEPIRRRGEIETYGPEASDKIRRLIRKK